MRSFAAALALALIASATVAAADDPARAKPSKADSAAAEALFEEGRKLLAAGQVKQACPKFAESYRLDPALGSLLNLATCHQLEGKTASAWGEFRDAEQQARRAGDAKRQKFASEKAASLEGSLPKLIVTVSETPKGLVVYRDGVALGEGSFNVPLPVDPGERVVRAEAPGKKPWETRVDAVTGKRSSVVIPELEAAAVSGDDGGGDPNGDHPTPAPDAPPASPGSGRTVGYVLGGVGLAGVAAGAVFGALFFGKKGDAEACKAPACPRATYDDAKSSADTFGTVSGVALGVGAAALVAGAVLILAAPSAPSTPPPTSSLRPWLGVSSSGATAGAVARF